MSRRTTGTPRAAVPSATTRTAMALAAMTLTASGCGPRLPTHGPPAADGGGARGEGEGERPSDAYGLRAGCDDDDDPLTQPAASGWVGFCADRADDNCAIDDDAPGCPQPSTASPTPCNSADEPCPATQPGAAAPAWDCAGAPPDGVMAYARFDDGNEQVDAFCAYVYESPIVAGEMYAAIVLDNGANTSGPDQKCSYDVSARRHLFFADLDGGFDCPGIRFTYPDVVDRQILSNRCRKMIRNVTRNDPDFEPDLQFFAATREEAQAKLAVLETAEIACVGIDDASGEPFRPSEVWVVQAAAPIQLVPN